MGHTHARPKMRGTLFIEIIVNQTSWYYVCPFVDSVTTAIFFFFGGGGVIKYRNAPSMAKRRPKKDIVTRAKPALCIAATLEIRAFVEQEV